MILMETTGRKNIETPISLYIHIPFCTKKCPYCHFYVLKDKEEDKNLLLECFHIEWQKNLMAFQNKKLVSIYFGGGTPSLFGEKRVDSLLSMISQSGINIAEDVEITLEANPETIDQFMMNGYKKAGINRVSIGVQSFDEETLKILGRTHDAKKALDAVYLTHQAGIDNISIDLMYDIPYQKISRWKEELEVLKRLPIAHLSLYNLTFEPATVFFRKKEELLKHVLKDEESLVILKEAIEKIEEAGLKRYEISAFAKEGRLSKHNIGYWTARSFLGFGPSAFSYYEGKRFRNVANLRKYAELLNKGESPIDFEERLENRDRQAELLAVELRLLKGVNLNDFEKKVGLLDKTITEVLKELEKKGWLQKKGHTLFLTDQGRLFYDSVASEII